MSDRTPRQHCRLVRSTTRSYEAPCAGSRYAKCECVSLLLCLPRRTEDTFPHRARLVPLHGRDRLRALAHAEDDAEDAEDDAEDDEGVNSQDNASQNDDKENNISGLTSSQEILGEMERILCIVEPCPAEAPMQIR